MYEADGAVWLRTTDFDDDKDRVLVKADGDADVLRLRHRLLRGQAQPRGNDLCIYLLGADHHGYVNRLRAVAACAGDDPDTSIEVLIGQLVKMVKGGEEVRLSKRAGNIITIDDLVDEVGTDAARYSLIRYPVDSPLVLDVDLLLKRTNDNPVYYVQYASARIASVLRNAAELGIDWRSAPFDPALLDHERENDLLGVLAEFPRVVASAAELREPHRIARYLERLATAYHRFYDVCRVLPMGDEPVEPLHIARLWLCAASGRCWSTAWTCSGSPRPSGCSGCPSASALTARREPRPRPGRAVPGPVSPADRVRGGRLPGRSAGSSGSTAAARGPRRSSASGSSVYARFARHRGSVLAGGLAFFALLSLVPAVLSLGAVVAMFVDPAKFVARRRGRDRPRIPTCSSAARSPSSTRSRGQPDRPEVPGHRRAGRLRLSLYAASRFVYVGRQVLDVAFELEPQPPSVARPGDRGPDHPGGRGAPHRGVVRR